jgi:hypothetical protein
MKIILLEELMKKEDLEERMENFQYLNFLTTVEKL